MNVKVKVEFDKNKILSKEKLRKQKSKKALINQIIKDTTPYVPMQEGTLYQSAISNQTRYDDKIVWNGPYARFLYFGKVMIGKITHRAWAKEGETKIVTNKALTYGRTHPLAGPKWYERAKKACNVKWIKIVEGVFKDG